MLARMWSKGKSSTLLVGMQIGVVSMENIMEIPQKNIKIEPQYNPYIFLLVYKNIKMKTLV